MIICICNALKACQLQSVAATGASSPGELFRRLGCSPVCGKCVPYMRECLKESCAAETTTEVSQ